MCVLVVCWHNSTSIPNILSALNNPSIPLSTCNALVVSPHLGLLCPWGFLCRLPPTTQARECTLEEPFLVAPSG